MIEQTNDLNPDRSQASLPFVQIISLCENFSNEWEPNQRPNIPSYLVRVADDAKQSLLVNLLQYEIQRRRHEGERPQAEEYIEHFPQFAGLVRKVFLESTSAGSSVDSVPDATASIDSKPMAASRLGDYRLLRELGRGGMGVVYEAVHMVRGNRVALKLLPQVDGSRLYRFKREFRSAADISHPNLIGLHSLESDGAQWFFTMELVEGVDFLDFVRPNGQLDEPRLRSALSQLALGVMALHRNHVIHRDLKPSNVMVTHDGHVILLDFGLVLELETANVTRTTEGIAGTPGYMAPEQAAGLPVSASGDWYSVGVMLYEALSGCRPFSGSLWEILQAKQTLDPPPLPESTAIPTDLAALCMRLLARDPQERPDALEIAKMVSSGLRMDSAPASGSGRHGLVGRELHLGALKEAYGALQRQREPQTVFISGRSGEGKTALGEHFLGQLRQDLRVVVMAGRCYDRESVPFKALDSLIDALASYLRALPETAAALLMPDDIGVLARVFPVLQRVEVVAIAAAVPFATLDEQQVRQRAFGALRSLLGRISRRSPIVWFIDDLQWGDSDSAEALFETLRPPEAPQVLLLCTYRSDETEGSAFLRTWKELQRKHDVRLAEREVKLAPLTVEECTELVIGLLGKDNDGIRARAIEFARETRGNPFLLTELVGCFDPDTDSFEPMPLHEVLDRKLGRLPDEAAHLLEVVAVSGQALSLEEASRTAGHALPPMATISRMRNERLVRMIGPEESPLVDTYHDRVRETILGRMQEGTSRTIHRTLAEVIEKDVGGLSAELIAALERGEKRDEDKAIPRVYDLAYHFDAAGEQRKAWIYALMAAEQARRQSALEVAVKNYATAQRNIDGTDKAVRYRIAVGYGESLMLLGRYDEANERLEGAMDLVADAERKAGIETLQGDLAFKQGLVAKSISLYESGLRRLGVWVPKSRLGLAFGVVRESVIQGVHSLLPFLLHRKTPNTRRELVIRVFRRVTHPYIFSNTPKLLWSQLSEMNRAERSPLCLDLGMSYALHAGLCSMLGWSNRGARYGDRSMTLARQFNDILGQGYSSNYQGIGHYASARYEEGVARLNEAIDAFDKAGDLYELHLAHFHRGCCHFGLGNLAEAVAEARWTFASSTRLGDSRTLCSSYLWARATRGNIPFEELKSCYPCRPDDVMSTVHGIMAEGHWHTFHGRTEEALQAFDRAGELVRKSLCVNAHMIVVMPELAGALRRHAGAIQANDAQQAEHLRRRAYRVAKWATRLTWLFPAAYPLALRERSLILAAFGKTRKALKYADKSCAVAEAQKAKYEHAQSLLVRSKLAKELALPEAEEQIRAAEAAIDEIERPIREGASRLFAQTSKGA
ncbi:MAG: protein kinase [Isosphaerales bacterium]